MPSLNRTLTKPSAYQSLGRLILLPAILFSACAPSIALDVTVHLHDKKNLTFDGIIVELIGADSSAQPGADHIIDQIDIAFKPFLSVRPKGTSITLTNRFNT